MPDARRFASPMSPQETQQQNRGLFLQKVHFRIPSAEGTFSFPRMPREDEEAGQDNEGHERERSPQ